METFDFPDNILELASKISLADLLDSPLTQCWAVSCITSSIGTNSFRKEVLTEKDELMEVKLIKLAKMLPYEEKNHLFDQCKALIHMPKEARAAKDQ